METRIFMDSKRILDLLFKKKNGTLSLREHAELAKMLDADASEPNLVKDLEKYLNVPLGFTNEVTEEDIALSLQKMHKRRLASGAKMRRMNISGWIKTASAIAASLLLAVVAVLFYIKKAETDKGQPNIVSTRKGAKSNIVLPDGTKVWINDDTKLTYYYDFKSRREVFLAGEAYFDVTHDEEHPFIVHTPTINIKVLGTVFNVRAYANEATTQTTLLKGAVEVGLNSDKNKRILLKPNEKVTIQNSYIQEKQERQKEHKAIIVLETITTDSVDASVSEIQWVKKRLAFNQEPLADIARELERWYDVTVTIDAAVAQDKRYSGIFENKSLEHVLQALQLTSGFNYTIRGNEVFIEK